MSSTPERTRSAERRVRPRPGPLFSVLVPVYDIAEDLLRRCLDSVLAQTCPDWELCLADDASPGGRVREVLAEYAFRDPRVRLVFRQENGGISAASNSALALAKGTYAALLDNDDELAPRALETVARVLAVNPGATYVFSDSDVLDPDGARCAPCRKPGWDPDLLRCFNYINHFSVFRTDLVRDLGGFDAAFDGAQDYDLMLRVAERAPAGSVVHVPEILYHWRAVPGSIAFHGEGKPYVREAGRRALEAHWRRLERPFAAERHGPRFYRSGPLAPPEVAVVALGPLEAARAAAWAGGLPEAPVLLPEDLGQARAEVLVFLDGTADELWNGANGTQISTGEGGAPLLADMAAHAARPGIGVVGLGPAAETPAVLAAVRALGGFTDSALHPDNGGGDFFLMHRTELPPTGCLAVRRELFLAHAGSGAGAHEVLCGHLAAAGLRHVVLVAPGHAERRRDRSR